jgi:hypothetical protein
MDKFYLVQIKRTKGVIEKGVVVKDTLDAAKQSFHAYLGAYAYGNNEDTDYVMVEILNGRGLGMAGEYWEKEVEPEPEPTPEPEEEA